MEYIFQDPTAQERCNLSLLIQGNLVWLRQHPSKGQSHGGRRRKTPGGNQKELWARRGLWWQRSWVLSPSHLLSLSSACKGITGHSGLWSQLSKVPCCCFWVTWGMAGPCPWRSEHFAELSFPAQTHGCITTHPGTRRHQDTPCTNGERGHIHSPPCPVLWGWCPVERGQHCCAMPQNAGGRSQVTASKTHHGRAHSSANTQMLCCWGIALQGQGIALHIPSKSFQRAKEKRKD